MAFVVPFLHKQLLNKASMQDSKIKTDAAAAASEASKRHGQKSGPQYVLSSLRYWDVVMSPTKRYMVAGRFVPSVRGAALPFLTKKRRITIELYTPAPPEVHVDNHNAEQTTKLFGQLLKGISSSALMQVGTIGDNDLVAFRILKPKRHNEPDSGTNDGDWDSHSIGSMSMSTLGFGASSDDTDVDAKNIRWKERYRCRLDTLAILNQKGKACDLKLGADSSAILKTITFESHHDLQTFLKVLNQMTRLREDRARRLTDSYKEMKLSSSSSQVSPSSLSQSSWNNSTARGSPSQKPQPQLPNKVGKTVRIVTTEDHDLKIKNVNDANDIEVQSDVLIPASIDPEAPFDNLVQILVEIVSASNLPVADILSSDPYIKVFDGSKEIHRTKVISKTLNPVWTVLTKSLFLINTTVENFFAGPNFITFKVKDYDAFKKNNTMGTVEISKDTLLKGTGERLDFDILTPGKSEMKRKILERPVRLTRDFL